MHALAHTSPVTRRRFPVKETPTPITNPIPITRGQRVSEAVVKEVYDSTLSVLNERAGKKVWFSGRFSPNSLEAWVCSNAVSQDLATKLKPKQLKLVVHTVVKRLCKEGQTNVIDGSVKLKIAPADGGTTMRLLGAGEAYLRSRSKEAHPATGTTKIIKGATA